MAERSKKRNLNEGQQEQIDKLIETGQLIGTGRFLQPVYGKSISKTKKWFDASRKQTRRETKKSSENEDSDHSAIWGRLSSSGRSSPIPNGDGPRQKER